MLSLTSKHRRELKARAHNINPIVIIGKIGLSPSIIAELENGLSCHELIKVKVQVDDREVRKGLLEEICRQLNAAPVQQIGKILVIYRPNPETTEISSTPTPYRKKSEPRRTKRSFQS